jgi:hypothetical protein
MFQFFNRDTDGQIKRDSIFIGLEEFDEETTIGFPNIETSENASFILFENNHSGLGNLFYSEKLDGFFTAEPTPVRKHSFQSLF